jgi:hypothetical protein
VVEDCTRTAQSGIEMKWVSVLYIAYKGMESDEICDAVRNRVAHDKADGGVNKSSQKMINRCKR